MGSSAYMHLDVAKLNKELATLTVQELLLWAWKNIQPLAMTSSFQTQGIPLLHLAAQTIPNLPILFLDTGYHFPETLLFRDQIVKRWGLNLQIIYPSSCDQKRKNNSPIPLYKKDPDTCCFINKTSPLQDVLAGLAGWISGIRRDQTYSRANIELMERLPQGYLRIHPLADWTKKDIWEYIAKHQLPEHPLLSQGYFSIGCKPCTRPVFEQETNNERAGRWANNKKAECGLHTLLRGKTFESST